MIGQFPDGQGKGFGDANPRATELLVFITTFQTT